MQALCHLHALKEKVAKYRKGEINPVTKIFWNLNYEVILREAFRASSAGDFVLDVGCGIGKYLIALSKGGRICFGIDPLREISLKPAKEEVKENVSISWCQGLGEFLPFKSGVFDIALLISTLQHVVDQHMTLREISRVLKEGGLLLVSVPTAKNISTLFREAKTPCYFTMGFSIRSFEKILVDCGFRVLKMKGCGFFPPFTYRFLYVFHRFFGEKLARKMVELLNVFADVWLSAASSLIALCEKG